MKFAFTKGLIFFTFFLLLSSSIILYCIQQDPVISMVCPLIKEGNNLDKVVEILEEDLKQRPQNHDVRLYLGIAYLKKGENELAFQQLKKIAEQLERMLGSERPFGDTIAFIDHRMQRKDRGVLSNENLGLFYFTHGLLFKLKDEPKEAEKRFKSSLKAGYEESSVRYQLFDLYLALKNYKAANKELKSLEKLDGEDEKILFLKGYLHYKDKKSKEARACFEKVISLKPDFLPAKKNLAFMEYNAGNYQKAVEIFQEIIQNNPSDKEAHINLGRAYFHAGELEKAQDEFKAAGLTIAVKNYSPKTIPLLSLQLTLDVAFKLNC